MDSAIVKTRITRAKDAMDESAASIAAKLNITPPAPLKREYAKHPDVMHRFLYTFENLVDFFRRLDSALPENSKTKKGAK